MTGLLLLLAVLPSIILGYIVYKNDKIEKEPTKLLVKLFLGGILSIVITLIITGLEYILFPNIGELEKINYITQFIYCFIGIAVIEEFSKWIILRSYTWNSKEFKHLYDAIVYACFVSLGFATLENILYVLQNGLGTALIRAIISVPGHFFFAVFMGIYYGLARKCYTYKDMEGYKKNIALSVLIPTLLHTAFDFCLLSENMLFLLIFLGMMIALYIISFGKLFFIADIKENFVKDNLITVRPLNFQSSYRTVQTGPVGGCKYCPNCGNLNKDENLFCTSCGWKFL